MRDPLIAPLLAVACGILLGKLFGFSVHEAASPVFAFLALWAVARIVRRKPLPDSHGSETAPGNGAVARICVLLAVFFVGVLAEAWHRPGPPPEIDAGSRETVILEGCVVEPTVFSAEREQFTLELDPGARARVTLPLSDNDAPERLDYGQHVEIDARVRRPHNYNNP